MNPDEDKHTRMIILGVAVDKKEAEARAAFDAGDFTTAISKLKEAIAMEESGDYRLSSHIAGLLLSMAVTYKAAGDLGEAEAHFKQVILLSTLPLKKRKPTNPESPKAIAEADLLSVTSKLLSEAHAKYTKSIMRSCIHNYGKLLVEGRREVELEALKKQYGSYLID